MDFTKLKNDLLNHLVNDIIPFWTNNCIDWENGGVNNIVSNDGEILSTDKYIWSQGRALWTFSAMYNYIDNKTQWLDIADNIYSFLIHNGRNDDNEWVFKTSDKGDVLVGAESIYVDAFVMLGMIEYSKASCCKDALSIAFDIYNNTKSRLYDHQALKSMPHKIPKGYLSHGIYMIYANAYHELYLISNNVSVLEDAVALADIVYSQHLNKEEKVLYEFVKHDLKESDLSIEKTFIPGHAIESMWFLERIYASVGDKNKRKVCLGAIRWHLEKGWDKEYNGIYLACNTVGEKPFWHKPESKIWWPIVEAMYGLLRAYEVLNEDWCLSWYEKVYKYAFSYFPNEKYGEWTQNLDRYGVPISVVVNDLQVKDPFHLPRALIYSINLLSKIEKESNHEK